MQSVSSGTLIRCFLPKYKRLSRMCLRICPPIFNLVPSDLLKRFRIRKAVTKNQKKNWCIFHQRKLQFIFASCVVYVYIIISIQRYIYKCKYKTHMQKQADSVVQVQTHSLTSDFGSSTRGERHNSYNAFVIMLCWPQCSAHLMVFKISVSRDPK